MAMIVGIIGVVGYVAQYKLTAPSAQTPQALAATPVQSLQPVPQPRVPRIEISDSTFVDGQSVISMPSDSDASVKMAGVHTSNVRKVVDLRDSTSTSTSTTAKPASN